MSLVENMWGSCGEPCSAVDKVAGLSKFRIAIGYKYLYLDPAYLPDKQKNLCHLEKLSAGCHKELCSNTRCTCADERKLALESIAQALLLQTRQLSTDLPYQFSCVLVI